MYNFNGLQLRNQAKKLCGIYFRLKSSSILINCHQETFKLYYLQLVFTCSIFLSSMLLNLFSEMNNVKLSLVIFIASPHLVRIKSALSYENAD
jgi:hypothetical protein